MGDVVVVDKDVRRRGVVLLLHVCTIGEAIMTDGMEKNDVVLGVCGNNDKGFFFLVLVVVAVMTGLRLSSPSSSSQSLTIDPRGTGDIIKRARGVAGAKRVGVLGTIVVVNNDDVGGFFFKTLIFIMLLIVWEGLLHKARPMDDLTGDGGSDLFGVPSLSNKLSKRTHVLLFCLAGNNIALLLLFGGALPGVGAAMTPACSCQVYLC